LPALAKALDKLSDGARLVAGRLKLADYFKSCGHGTISEQQ
jgi:hypothetical protein